MRLLCSVLATFVLSATTALGQFAPFADDPRIELQVHGVGASTTVWPEGARFFENESEVILSAELEDESDAFLYWIRVEGDDSHKSISYQGTVGEFWLSQNVGILAVAGRRIELSEGVFITIPRYGFEVSEDEGFVTIEALDVGIAQNVVVSTHLPKTIYLEVEAIDSDARFRATNLSAGSSATINLGQGINGFESYSVIVGKIRLREFVEETPLMPIGRVKGAGVVNGLPAVGEVPDQPYEIVAVPDDGWRFAGWDSDPQKGNPLEIHNLGILPRDALFVEDAPVGEFVAGFERRELWDVVESDMGPVLKSLAQFVEGESPTDNANIVRFELEGPGEFSYRVRHRGVLGGILADGQYYSAFDNVWFPCDVDSGLFSVPCDIDTKRSIELKDGRHFVDVEFSGFDERLDNQYLELSEIEWKPGYPVSASALDGGAISGLEALGLDGRAAAGATLHLEATPKEGYSFFGWRGTHESNNSSLEFTVHQPVKVLAEFKRIISDDAVWKGSRGTGTWEKNGSTWKSPESLDLNGFADLTGVVQGPARLSVPYAQTDYRLSILCESEKAVSYFSHDRFGIVLPAGRFEFRLRVKSDDSGVYTSVSSDLLKIEYKVLFDVGSGSLYTNFDIPASGTSNNIYEGYVESGSTIAFVATGHEGANFNGWSGDFSGDSLSGSIVVNGPRSVFGRFDLPSVIMSQIEWNVEPSSSVNVTDYNSLYIKKDYSSVVLSRLFEGPGELRWSTSSIRDVDVFVDGSFVETKGLSNGGKFWIGEGSHEVALRFNSEIPGLGGWVQSLVFTPGFFLDLGTSRGGTIRITPEKESYSEGEIVTLEAIPNSDNRFVAWRSPFGEEAQSFQYVVSDHASLEALFESLEASGDITYAFSGIAPIGGGRKLWYDFDGSGSPIEGDGSATISGPGRIWVKRERSDNIVPYSLVLTVDGVRWDLSDPYGNNSLSVYLEDGEHQISWTIESANSDYGHVALEFGQVQNAFSVAATASGATISVEGEKATYSPDDLVTFTAPVEDQNGKPFRGWWKKTFYESPTDFVSSDRVLNLRVRETAAYVALYEESPMELVGGIVRADEIPYFFHWLLVDGAVTPNGDPVWEAKSAATMRVFVDEGSVVRFYLNSKSVGEIGSINVGDSEVVYPISGEYGWNLYDVYVPAQSYVEIRVDLGSTIQIGGFSITPGWGPSVFRVGIGELDYSANPSEAANGEFLTAAPQESDAGRFYGWRAEDGLLLSQDDELIFEVGEAVTLRPVFGKPPMLPDGVSLNNGKTRGWRFGESAEPGDWWMSEQPAESDFDNTLSLQVLGPGILVLGAGVGAPTIRVNGAEQDTNYWYSIEDGGQFLVTLPTDENEVELIHHASEAQSKLLVQLLGVEPGFVYTDGDRGRGRVIISPRRRIYQKGDVVNVAAVADRGFRFAGWSEPFADAPERFSFVANEAVELMPKFERETQTVSAFGFEWECIGANFEYVFALVGSGYPSRYLKASYDPEMTRATATTTVVGPKTIILRSGTLKLDGIPVVESGTGSYQEPFLVPSGEHVLVAEFTLNGGTSLEILVVDGANIERISAGGDLSISPGLVSLPVGTLVEARFDPAYSGETIEWIGLPDDAEGDELTKRFVVRDHLQIEVRGWRDDQLFGYPFKHAGNTTWNYSAENERYWLTNPGPFSADYLMYNATYSGSLKFETGKSYTDYQSDVRFRLEIDGKSPLIDRQYEHIRDTVRNLEQGMETLFVFENRKYDTRGASFSLEEFVFSPDSERNFRDWWNQSRGENAFESEKPDPSADLDGDGYSNYEEYILDMNPSVADLPLRVLGRTGDLLDIEARRIPTLWRGDFLFEGSRNLSSWIALDAVDDEGSESPGIDQWIRYLIDTRSLDSDSVFLRRRFTGTIPTLEELANEP